MGSVWRAQRADGRYEGTVAIKFVHAAWIGAAGEQRFRIEGNLLGRLDHPNIARLLDAGMLDGTQPYLIIEYVEGEPIDAYCDRHQLRVEARVKLFLDVLAAVAHAHSHLIVHRDLKPSNVLVTRDGTVKLLDFGIAKLLDAGSGVGESTQTSASALTPQYAAPEQLLGQGVTTTTDVYALGLLLYVLLTGSHPLVPSGSRSNAEFLKAIVSDVPPQASSVAGIATIPRRMLAGDLDNILHRTLKKEPAERYATVGAFAEDLQCFLTHRPVHARADTLQYRTQKFVRRHRGGVAVGLLSLGAVLAGIVGTVWQAHRADLNARRAEHERARAIDQLSYAEASNEFLSFLLQVGADRPFTTPELLARGEAMVTGQFTNDPDLRARLLLTLADLNAQIENEAKAETLFVAAQSAASAARDDVLGIEIDCSLAMEYADQNQFDRSLAMLNSTLQRAHSTPDVDRSVIAGCLDQRSQVRRGRGDMAGSLIDAQAALATLGTPRPGQRTLALSARTTLATANARLGHAAAAIEQYEQAIGELDRMGRGQTDFAVTLLNSEGVVLAKSGQWLTAAAVYERGLAIAHSVSGGAEISPQTQINYAKLLVDLGREREALPLFDAARAVAQRRGDVKAIEMVDLLSAPALCDLGRLDECAARLQRSGATLHQQLPPGHATLGTHETEWAQLAVARGQRPDAQQHLRTALKIFAATSEHNPNELRAMALLAEIDLTLGNLAAARAEADDVVAQARGALGGLPGSAWLGRALLVQGEVLRAQGHADAARAAWGAALRMLSDTAGEQAPWTGQTRRLLTDAGAPRKT
jgi:serine/threonine-protein kinase